MRLPSIWSERLERVDYALQPIVSVSTGVSHAFEALLRGTDRAGFASIADFFDAAAADGALLPVEMALREKALRKFVAWPQRGRAKLFCNIDNRTLDDPNYDPAATLRLCDAYGFPPNDLCLEVSERFAFSAPEEVRSRLVAYKRRQVQIALDDFGSGYAGLQFLFECEPHVLKLDRFFVASIADDHRKRLFVTSIVNLAHTLGMSVLAEGVETLRELRVCIDVGCDLAQGWLIGRPTVDFDQLRPAYPEIGELGRGEQRAQAQAARAVEAYVVEMPTVASDLDVLEIQNVLREHGDLSFAPVVNAGGEPVGLARERDLRRLLLSEYGRDLLRNQSYRRVAADVAVKCPAIELGHSVERIVDAFSSGQGDEGVIVTRNGRYAGFVPSSALVNLVSERNVAAARDQNPLTRLPGNARIHDYVTAAAADIDHDYVLAYFDFDFFKPFNDAYGFRQGDRALLLFAQIAGDLLPKDGCFLGHIGGDDFFVGFKGVDFDAARAAVVAIGEKFRRDVVGFYDAESRERGVLLGKDRDGAPRVFPMLGVSAALLRLPAGRHAVTPDALSARIADAKTCAKHSGERICVVEVGELVDAAPAAVA